MAVRDNKPQLVLQKLLPGNPRLLLPAPAVHRHLRIIMEQLPHRLPGVYGGQHHLNLGMLLLVAGQPFRQQQVGGQVGGHNPQHAAEAGLILPDARLNVPLQGKQPLGVIRHQPASIRQEHSPSLGG
ncbi:hypothetical protein D3C75_916930 [compost metagenome]